MIILIVACSILALILTTRIPLGFILMAAGILGIAAIHPKGLTIGITIASQQMIDLAMSFQFSVLPLFILMGTFVAHAGLADDLFETCYRWFGHLRGGLAISTVAACGGFAAITGSSAASAATMSRIAVPSMRKFNYDEGFSTATVAAGGTIGILIPPSSALIVYGLLTETNITHLFMAGLIPGIISIIIYIIAVSITIRILPSWGPRGERFSWRDRLLSLSKIWGVVVLFLLILGGIFSGLFTTTEAGGIGAGGALAFALFRRKMNWRIFKACLFEATKTSSMIFIVVAGALTLNQFVNLSGLPNLIVGFITDNGLTPMTAVFFIIGFYLILGMFIDGFAMIFLTVPIFAPVLQALGLDLIWWGIVVVMLVEISLVTPPVGLNLYILHSMNPDVPLSAIFRGVVPYFAADIIRLSLVLFFPQIALYLPSIIG